MLEIKYHIRKMEESDIPEVFALVKRLSEYEKLIHEVTASEDLYKEHGFGSTSYFQAILAESIKVNEPNLFGFALYFFTFSTFTGKPTLYLEDLFVLPEFRGLGIGKSLLKELAKIALEKGCGRMEWSVLDWNKPAISFYRSLGAKPMNDWTVFRLQLGDIKKLASG
jgi:GNAT superfamily N-acetyltransferase